MSTIHTEATPPKREAFFLTIGLIVVAILGNAFVPHLFSQSLGPTSDVFMALLCGALGILVAQPCLLAVWASLAIQKPLIRIVVSVGVLCLVTLVYLASLASLAPGLPIELILIVVGVSFGMCFLAAMPVCLFRLKSKHVLAVGEAKNEVDQSIQFGIRHIFFLMTGTAILIPIAKMVFEKSGSEPGGGWLVILVFIAFYLLLTWGAFLFAIACVFAARRAPHLIALLVYVVVMPALVIFTLSYFFLTFSFDVGVCVFGTCFVACFAITIIAVLSMYRSIGYRLRPV